MWISNEGHYLISAFAPDASSFLKFPLPHPWKHLLIGFGAPSTSSLASLSQTGDSLTSLITAIQLLPNSVRITSNSVFSSPPASPASPPPAGAATATAAGAAALTPHLSSSSFTRSAILTTDWPLSHSTIDLLLYLTLFYITSLPEYD